MSVTNGTLDRLTYSILLTPMWLCPSTRKPPFQEFLITCNHTYLNSLARDDLKRLVLSANNARNLSEFFRKPTFGIPMVGCPLADFVKAWNKAVADVQRQLETITVVQLRNKYMEEILHQSDANKLLLLESGNLLTELLVLITADGVDFGNLFIVAGVCENPTLHQSDRVYAITMNEPRQYTLAVSGSGPVSTQNLSVDRREYGRFHPGSPQLVLAAVPQLHREGGHVYGLVKLDIFYWSTTASELERKLAETVRTVMTGGLAQAAVSSVSALSSLIEDDGYSDENDEGPLVPAPLLRGEGARGKDYSSSSESRVPDSVSVLDPMPDSDPHHATRHVWFRAAYQVLGQRIQGEARGYEHNDDHQVMMTLNCGHWTSVSYFEPLSMAQLQRGYECQAVSDSEEEDVDDDNDHDVVNDSLEDHKAFFGRAACRSRWPFLNYFRHELCSDQEGNASSSEEKIKEAEEGGGSRKRRPSKSTSGLHTDSSGSGGISLLSQMRSRTQSRLGSISTGDPAASWRSAFSPYPPSRTMRTATGHLMIHDLTTLAQQSSRQQSVHPRPRKPQTFYGSGVSGCH